MIRIFILFIFTTSLTSLGQNRELSDFSGTWQSRSGNTLFVVSLWTEGDRLFGHYKMVEYNNGTIGNIIYKSNKVYASGFTFPYVISGALPTNNEFSGSVDDNTIYNSNENYISGDLNIKTTEPVIIGCTNCTLQATWKIARPKGLQYG